MKIVVDKKITKLDGDVEDLLQTSQIVEETEGIKIINEKIEVSSNIGISEYSIKELHIQSDISVDISITQNSNNIVDIEGVTEFSFVGQRNYVEVSIDNPSETDEAKIKIVVVE